MFETVAYFILAGVVGYVFGLLIFKPFSLGGMITDRTVQISATIVALLAGVGSIFLG